jgi:tetratricopeptide (TPR) repeat protein
LGDIANLNKAIMEKQRAVHLTPDSHPHKLLCYSNLGNSLLYRFEHLRNIVDLIEAIAAQQQAAYLTPDGHPDKPGYLNNLGTLFLPWFKYLGNIADLDKAIMPQLQAVHLTPEGHPDKPRYLSNLGATFLYRFEHQGDIADLDKAITAQQQAVSLIPDSHHGKPNILNILGNSFRARLNHHPDDATFAQAIGAYSQSAKSSSGPPFDRFRAARIWATLCFSVHSNETIDAYSVLIDLLPRVVWLGRTVEQCYKDISTIGDAVTDAAAAAIYFGKFNFALKWLEEGRSIVSGQLLQLRSPLDELRQCHPDEANELAKISRVLDSASIADSSHLGLSNNDMHQSLEEAAQAHRRLAEKYDHVLARIHKLPGFNEFLRPPKTASLCGAAMSGPVIVVNVQKTRCDALILRPYSSQISHVPLPGLRVPMVKEMQLQLAGWVRGENAIPRHYAPDVEVDMEFSDILGGLWTHVVEPILSFLKVSHSNLCLILVGLLIVRTVATKAHVWEDATHYMVFNRAPHPSSCTCRRSL